jgi:hypothetical protein
MKINTLVYGFFTVSCFKSFHQLPNYRKIKGDSKKADNGNSGKPKAMRLSELIVCGNFLDICPFGVLEANERRDLVLRFQAGQVKSIKKKQQQKRSITLKLTI